MRKLKQKFDANGNLSAVTRLANAIIIIVVAARPTQSPPSAATVYIRCACMNKPDTNVGGGGGDAKI